MARRLAAVAAGAALALCAWAPAASAADTQMLLVHGYGEAKSCNGATWKDALAYFTTAGGRARSSMSTVGYYAGDRDCDVTIGDGQAGTNRPIQDLARDLARHIHAEHTAKGRPVDIVAHSMGGLITRVAILGSAQGWQGFPPRLDVEDVVTLGTPHQGVIVKADAPATRQWGQMRPGSAFLARLHEPGSGMGDDWADGTDWTFVGSAEDGTVSRASAQDTGADQELGYRANTNDAGAVTHTGIRTATGAGGYDLDYSGDGATHHTLDGWSPLKAAFRAATRDGDGLPG